MRISDWSSDVCSSDLDDPAPAGARGGDVFEAFDLDPAPQRIDRPPPRACELEHADRQRAEVFAQQRFARGAVEAREAQLQVAKGDAPPLAPQSTHQRAQGRATREIGRTPRSERMGADMEDEGVALHI